MSSTEQAHRIAHPDLAHSTRQNFWWLSLLAGGSLVLLMRLFIYLLGGADQWRTDVVSPSLTVPVVAIIVAFQLVVLPWLAKTDLTGDISEAKRRSRHASVLMESAALAAILATAVAIESAITAIMDLRVETLAAAIICGAAAWVDRLTHHVVPSALEEAW